MESYLSQKEITIKLGISISTLWRLRRAGDFPEPVRVSERRVVWRLGDVENYLNSRQVGTPVAEPVAAGG